MKKVLLFLFVPLLLVSCRKNTDLSDPSSAHIRSLLQEQLSAKDFETLDLSRIEAGKLSNGHSLYRVKMASEFVVLDIAQDGTLAKGVIYSLTGKIAKVKNKAVFSGVFERASLQRTNVVHYAVENGFAKELHTLNSVATNGLQQRVMYECADCTLPEVVVSSSYSGGGISWGAWMNLLAMFDMGGPMDYLAWDFSGGGGGGGGSASTSPVITIDQENSESKNKIEPKKYTDCFGNIPDNSTTLYTITISADLPTDGHPEIFYNWSDGSPGHAFIELSKSTPYGGVSQDFGFYPTNSYKLITLDNNTSLPSKIVDDGGHEYQARYTISVSASQFQAAVNAVNNPRDTYNVGLYNCTDFALDVFNAAGGNLSIPRHAIPGFEIDGGSNTPQGLFEKIQSMNNNGTANTTTTNNKEYAGSSKGPCN